jgi:hypothetical protein
MEDLNILVRVVKFIVYKQEVLISVAGPLWNGPHFHIVL